MSIWKYVIFENITLESVIRWLSYLYIVRGIKSFLRKWHNTVISMTDYCLQLEANSCLSHKLWTLALISKSPYNHDNTWFLTAHNHNILTYMVRHSCMYDINNNIINA